MNEHVELHARAQRAERAKNLEIADVRAEHDDTARPAEQRASWRRPARTPGRGTSGGRTTYRSCRGSLCRTPGSGGRRGRQVGRRRATGHRDLHATQVVQRGVAAAAGRTERSTARRVGRWAASPSGRRRESQSLARIRRKAPRSRVPAQPAGTAAAPLPTTQSSRLSATATGAGVGDVIAPSATTAAAAARAFPPRA